MKETTKDFIREEAIRFARTATTILFAATIIIAGLFLVSANSQRDERLREQQTLNANLAIACVLTLPVTDDGRNENLVQECFTQYGLKPPITHGPN